MKHNPIMRNGRQDLFHDCKNLIIGSGEGGKYIVDRARLFGRRRPPSSLVSGESGKCLQSPYPFSRAQPLLSPRKAAWGLSSRGNSDARDSTTGFFAVFARV